MAGPGLPTNIAAGGTTTGHKTHSDTIHNYVNKLDTTFLSSATSGNLLVWNGTTWRPTSSGAPNPIIQGRPSMLGAEIFGSTLHRIPINHAVEMDGSLLTAANAADKVAVQNSVLFKGGFTAEAGFGLANPGWLWGANDFIETATASNAISGIQDIRGRLTELHLSSPNSTLNTAWAMQIDTEIESTGTAVTVTDWGGLWVKAPNNSAGGGVTVTNAAAVKFGSPNVGTTRRGLLQEGEAANELNGDILMNDDPSAPHTLNAYDGTVRGLNALVGPTAASDAGFVATGRLNAKSKADADIVCHFAGRGGQSADIMRVATDTTINSRFDKNGRFGTRVTSAPADADVATSEGVIYVDNAVGNPRLMCKMKDSAGTVFTRQLSN